MISTQNINHAKKEISRLKRLKKRFTNEPEAVKDINKLLKKNYLFVSRGQEILQNQNVKL